MPLYEYRCRACENVFEYIQGLSEGPKRKCEECGGRLEKLVSRSGFVLKGSGWYETDFKDQGSKSSKPKGSDSSSSKPAAAKPDSKPGSKADSKGGDKPSPSSPKRKD